MAYVQFLIRDIKKAKGFAEEIGSNYFYDSIVDYINEQGYDCSISNSNYFNSEKENQTYVFEIEDSFFGNHTIRENIEKSGIEIKVLHYD